MSEWWFVYLMSEWWRVYLMSILERDQRSSRVEPSVLHFHPIFILSRLAILCGVTS
jgi:hypothetical protein